MRRRSAASTPHHTDLHVTLFLHVLCSTPSFVKRPDAGLNGVKLTMVKVATKNTFRWLQISTYPFSIDDQFEDSNLVFVVMTCMMTERDDRKSSIVFHLNSLFVM